MRAVVFDRYGPPEVLRVEEVERPVPKDDDVLVRVHATTVTRTDTGLRSAEYGFMRLFTGFRRPRQRIPGIELAGVVEEAGAAVTEFAVGDRVFGIGSATNAEFVRVRASGTLAHIPSNVSFAEAAAIADGGCTALAFLEQVHAEPGQRILVYGASGSIGTAAVQLAKQLGAVVIAFCGSDGVDVVRSLGADEVVDFRQRDVTETGESYDVIVDAVGKLSARRARRALKPKGIYTTAGSPGSLGGVLALGLVTKISGKRRVRLGLARYRREDLLSLKELVEAGAYRPVIDRSYALEDVVEAHRYVDKQRKIGNVVLTVDDTAR
ncbi:MAG TPA: NAD(P)-dependent alcohol dehydrogenase [Actinomycetota bacterium]|nr:NAD(P)-dependent alcohol dehydrogenase [Actinomycetota bacterium]